MGGGSKFFLIAGYQQIDVEEMVEFGNHGRNN